MTASSFLFLPRYFPFWHKEKFTIEFDDDTMISFCIFGYIYIQSEIDCAHDCVSALFVNDVFDSRTVGINDSLTTVRKLKEKGVEVYFQKENIYTLDSKGELLITIMSSLAQEESRSISENVTWGQRKRFADGKVSIAYSSFLGYQKGEDGQMEIVPEEAEIVRLIYRMFMKRRLRHDGKEDPHTDRETAVAAPDD